MLESDRVAAPESPVFTHEEVKSGLSGEPVSLAVGICSRWVGKVPRLPCSAQRRQD